MEDAVNALLSAAVKEEKEELIEVQKREQGIVKWFSAEKGYGFIERHNGEPNAFVHFTAILGNAPYKTLAPDEPVEFEVVDGKKGPQAVRVRSLG